MLNCQRVLYSFCSWFPHHEYSSEYHHHAILMVGVHAIHHVHQWHIQSSLEKRKKIMTIHPSSQLFPTLRNSSQLSIYPPAPNTKCSLLATRHHNQLSDTRKSDRANCTCEGVKTRIGALDFKYFILGARYLYICIYNSIYIYILHVYIYIYM